MRLKISIMFVGLLFLSNFAELLGSKCVPADDTGEKIITIRRLECYPTARPEPICGRTIELIVTERSTGRAGGRNIAGEALRLTTEYLSPSAGAGAIPPEILIS